MSSDAQDIAVARYLKQEGMVSPDQLAKALQVQAKSVEGGKPVSLAAALVEVGAITPVQRETLEKRIKSDEKKGTQQLLHYRIRRKLGEGGMGAVYLAEDTKLGRQVALKVLPRKHAADPEFMKRFKRESDAACRLHHPNIVRAFEAGEDVGYHFYVMEYCEGEPLDRALKRTGLLSWHRSFEIVRGVTQGLKYAHEQGFIHRDIKPANIFIASDGTPKILDLGLTKKIDESQLSFQTLSGAVVGTPHYLSPEQAKSDKAIDGRSDIYSLGATLYHLLTGEPPFSGTTLYEILSKHVNAELPNPQDVAEDIPDGVVHVLRKMMAKAPKDRFADCGELLKDVELVLQGKTPESAALGAGASAVAQLRKRIDGARKKRAGTYRVPAAATSRRSRAALLWVGLAAIAVLVPTLIVLLTSGRSTPRPEEPREPPRETLTQEDQILKDRCLQYISDFRRGSIPHVMSFYAFKEDVWHARNVLGHLLQQGETYRESHVITAKAKEGLTVFRHAGGEVTLRWAMLDGSWMISEMPSDLVATSSKLGSGWAETEARYRELMAEARDAERKGDWVRVGTLCYAAFRIKPGTEEVRSLLAEAQRHLGHPSLLTLDLGSGVGMEFVYIGPGTFTMGGTDATAVVQQKDERPPHQVTITKGYYLGKYEVTRGQFAAFVRETGYKTDAEKAGKAYCWIDGGWKEVEGVSWQNPKPFTQTDDHPAMCISWNDAKAFCDWAGKKNGREVRLPTEAEWEYACRAGTKTRWSFGDTESGMGEYGWYNKNSGMQTQPVGQKKPNGWGLYDMHGNVWEWVQDWSGAYGGDAARDPQGPAGGQERCRRGGSWDDDAPHCRSALRVGGAAPVLRSAGGGFRACLP